MTNTVNAPDPSNSNRQVKDVFSQHASNWPRLYAILNEDAKSWWYHKQLSQSTNPADNTKGRKLELQSIKSRVQTLREWRTHNTVLRWHEGSGQYSCDDVPTYDPITGKVNGSHSLSFGGYRHGNALAIAAYYMGLTILNASSAPHTRMIAKAQS